MAIVILPDAQEDLLSLQEYMLDKWDELEWLKAEDAIFEKLEQVDAGSYPGISVKELESVGIFEYRNIFTSPHKLVYRRIDSDIYVYVIAGHRQDFATLMMKRLLKK
ncbi:type II toxin-antitoxin system RelE/ParE family toxin [Herbaspirillum sp. RTI4]|uniref:type II toxin-antitoxin system RelE/ParE family toxin n=1 Tax=Herbaspirillum sp. RTI4 TaxID=3048640 RepID=UPI002AB571AE|nr:type II toxin-antitoxin system RelE/ParE family toxin [Herbaspirillum sp. RTI4]MDY7579436.1 type II toxin-antitoxin system RelE/ParE family toxin [Herbaspirillum sp. RTI4]MEA9980350.1 type II toxin-antitoxin system RelE/ParE family toxin [Herbaspirillum sp. RTI4]